MENLESYRKYLNKQQTDLRRILTSSDQFDQAITLVLSQHAMLHSAKMAQTGAWSFEDAILNDMTETQIRRIPHNCDHSVAWTMWHMARIEDVAMNMLVAGRPQILSQENWPAQLKVTSGDTGNAMDKEEVVSLSTAIDIEALRAYRLAVGRRTREIIKQLQPQTLKQMVDPDRLQRVQDERAVLEAASDITDYWGKRTIAGLLLMPATRHNLVHLNEALRLKQKQP
jgi:hypothetical protein